MKYEGLDKALGAVREAAGDMGAPPAVEVRLMREFRSRTRRGPGLGWWWSAVAVSAAAMFVMVWIGRRPAVEAPPRIAKAPTAPVALARAPGRRAVVVASVPPARKANPRVTAVPEREAAARNEFVAIPYAPPVTQYDRGEIYRVRLPRSSIRRLGIPFDLPRDVQRVPADLFVGEDGIPRGIRLVNR